jgi:ubiquinone/menaquinone biosynthesis C-methylase UbiE
MRLRALLFRIYWALQKRIAPGLRYSQALYEEMLASHVDRETTWLDLGCGHQILPAWRAEQEKELVQRSQRVVGIDADRPSLLKHRTLKLKIAGNIGRLPCPPQTFSLVTANMVVEHLDAPAAQFAEIARVLKPGGVFILHTPNRRGYATIAARLIPNAIKKKLVYLIEGRKPDDVFDTFYRANSKEDIEKLAEAAGFTVQRLRLAVTSAELAVIPPLVIFELLWIRLLMTRRLKPLRSTIIAVLQRKASV